MSVARLFPGKSLSASFKIADIWLRSTMHGLDMAFQRGRPAEDFLADFASTKFLPVIGQSTRRITVVGRLWTRRRCVALTERVS